MKAATAVLLLGALVGSSSAKPVGTNSDMDDTMVDNKMINSTAPMDTVKVKSVRDRMSTLRATAAMNMKKHQMHNHMSKRLKSRAAVTTDAPLESPSVSLDIPDDVDESDIPVPSLPADFPSGAEDFDFPSKRQEDVTAQLEDILGDVTDAQDLLDGVLEVDGDVDLEAVTDIIGDVDGTLSGLTGLVDDGVDLAGDGDVVGEILANVFGLLGSLDGAGIDLDLLDLDGLLGTVSGLVSGLGLEGVLEDVLSGLGLDGLLDGLLDGVDLDGVLGGATDVAGDATADIDLDGVVEGLDAEDTLDEASGTLEGATDETPLHQ